VVPSPFGKKKNAISGFDICLHVDVIFAYLYHDPCCTLIIVQLNSELGCITILTT
jgi:hypothetical protein